MNRLEYNVLMNTIGLDNVVTRSVGARGQLEDVHLWPSYPLIIWYYGTSYAIVKGTIPSELAEIIYEKYPGKKYGIGINGGRIDINPKDESVRYYHIDTKEGLLAFITEFEDYELRQKGLPETEVDNYDKLLGIINEKLLTIANPGVSPQDCVKGLIGDTKEYRIALENTKNSEIGLYLRKAINNFDKAVNPYLDNNIELDSVENYSKNVTLGVYSNENTDKNNIVDCELRIKKGEDYEAEYTRYNYGFIYRFSYRNFEGQSVIISHSFFTRSPGEVGEKIDIRYLGEGNKSKHILLNISKGKIEYSGMKKSTHKVSDSELIEVIRELEITTYIAKRHVIRNMEKNVRLQHYLKGRK